MDLFDKKTIKQTLKNLPALKKFGQNFLIDKNILKKIAEAAKLTKDDIVLEIGPGLGSLTQELVKKSKKVIAIEKDKRMVKLLKNNLKAANLRIVEADALYGDYSLPKNYKLIANLPYNISVPLIRKFLEAQRPPKIMILMTQLEVAEKICSQKTSILKIAVEFYGKAEFLFKVPKEKFLPQPKVDGGVIRIDKIQKSIPNVDKKKFFELLKSGFAYPRKTILNNLSKKLKIEKGEVLKLFEKADINPKKRPQDIDFKHWVKLFNSFHN